MKPGEKVTKFASKYNMSISLALELMIEMFDEEAFAKSDLVKRVPMSLDELMATFSEKEALKAIDAVAPTQKNGSGRPKGGSRYQWDKWFDGKPHTLTQGAGFKTEVASFQASAHAAAKARNLRVKTRTNGDKVTIQSFKGKKR